MLQFVDLKKETPVKRETVKRKQDFDEIYNEFISDKAKEQSSSVLNVVYHFAKYIALYRITFLIG